MQYPESVARGRREGSGSTEATEMILNNLFYITTKVMLMCKMCIKFQSIYTRKRARI